MENMENINYPSPITIEEVTDPAELARFKSGREQFERNSAWLESHWADLLPQARGKIIAVAGQEAVIADSIEEAWAWAEKAHPEDQGAFVRYVIADPGPRIYANHRQVATVR